MGVDVSWVTKQPPHVGSLSYKLFTNQAKYHFENKPDSGF